ncbi:MAG: glycosyltransferase family 2 protein [Sphingomicrobium sp.]
MASPLASVIVPVFNRAGVVGQAVTSLADQTLENIEIIVVDDGSSDASAEVAERAGGQRVRVIRHSHNRGIPAARNTGLQAAAGKYIAWLDSDDLARPQRLQRQASFLEKHPEIAFVGSSAGRIDSNGRRKRRTIVPLLSHEALAPALLFRSPFQQSSIMGRSEILKAFEYRPDFPVCEDLDMFIRLSRRYRAANLKEVLIDRRIHAAQIGRLESAQVRGLKRRLLRPVLAELGVHPTEDDLDRHVTLGALKAQPQSPEFLAWAGDWMMALQTVNKSTQCYDAKGLALVCARNWVNACNAAVRANHGIGLGSAMLASSLALGFASKCGVEWLSAALPGLLGF